MPHVLKNLFALAARYPAWSTLLLICFGWHNPGDSQDVIFEDWSDRNLQAPAIEWAPEGGGTFDVIDASSGNLYIKTSGGGTAFFLASQNIPPSGEFSMRILYRPIAGDRSGIGLIPGRFWSTVQSDGTLRIGQDGFEVISDSSFAPFLSDRIMNQDYYLQFDFNDGVLSAFAWPAGVINPPIFSVDWEPPTSLAFDQYPVLWTTFSGAEVTFKTVEIANQSLGPPVVPLERVALDLNGATGDYHESFDSLDDSNKLQLFPPGWTGFGGHEEPAVFFAVNSEMGPQRQSVSRFAGIGSFYNAGLPDDPDRALVTVVRATANGKLDGNEIELLTRITDADAKGLRLQFDIEAWNAFSRLVTESGEAAFDVKVEIDAGSGYESLVDLGRQSTGRVLLLPEARDTMINGNDAANRTTVDLVAPDVAIPAGAKMRIRFITAEDETAGTGGWFFGLDNLSLQLSPQSGDASGDRSVDFDDFVRLANHFAMPGTWGDGDFDLDGIVAFPDFVILAQNFQALGEDTAITSVPEPSCASMMLIAASIIPVMVSRRNIVFFIAWSEPTSPGRAASN